MSRRKKDSLRPLTDAERQSLTQLGRSQVEPAVRVIRAKILLAVARGEGYHHAAHPSAEAPSMPSRTWSPASTGSGWPPYLPAMAAANHATPATRPGSGSFARPGESRRPRPTARRPGRSRPCGERSDWRPMACPSSPTRRSGRSSMQADVPAAPVHPRRHGQDPHAVPSGRRTGPDQGGDGMPEHRTARLAQAGIGRRAGRDAQTACDDDRRGRSFEEAMGAVARGPDHQADAPGGATAAADALGAGQPGRAQDARVGLLAVRAGDHAAVHAGGRVVAEHGPEYPADLEASRLGRAASERGGPDRRVVRGGGRPLERVSDAVRLGWEAGGPTSASAGASPSAGRLGSVHPRTDLTSPMFE